MTLPFLAESSYRRSLVRSSVAERRSKMSSLQSSWDYSRSWIIFPGHVGVVSAVSSFHGESLASASLSVGEDCAVVPLHHLTNQRLHNAPIHFQLLALDAKHFVKLEGLSEGGGGLLLDGDLLGVRGVHHAV